MKNIKIACLLLIPFLYPAISQADYFTKYIWYRAEHEFSRIVITEETIRGHRGVDQFVAKAKEYKKVGKYHTYGHGKPQKKITKVEKMDGHEIKTELLIKPPSGNGQGSAVPWCSIRVFFDGELKLECPIGYSYEHSMTVAKVIIHAEEGAAEVIHYNDTPSSEPVFNSFNISKEIIVIEKDKLISKPIKKNK